MGEARQECGVPDGRSLVGRQLSSQHWTTEHPKHERVHIHKTRPAVPSAGFAAIMYWRPAMTWLDLILYVGGYTLLFAAFVARSIPEVAFVQNSRIVRRFRGIVEAGDSP